MLHFYWTIIFPIAVSLVEVESGRPHRLALRGSFYGINEMLETHVAQNHLDQEPKAKIRWFDQKLDHLHTACTETWKQRFAKRMDFYDGNGVIFLFIQGEGPMNVRWLDNSAMSDYTKEYKAARFILEHRFYGKSRPKPDLSLESLKYLTSEQALADLAYFITRMNAEHDFSNPKWVVFGGSYAGALATWLRYKYPHLVHAAVSSSSPLLAKLDFPGKDGAKTILKIQNVLCEPLENNEKDIASFFEILANSMAYMVQMGVENIHECCEIVTKKGQSESLVKRYAHLHKLIWRSVFGEGVCVRHTYNDMLHAYNQTSWSVKSYPWRQWLYQTCTEFGDYPTASTKDTMFGDKVSLKYFVGLCTDKFGLEFNESFVKRGIEETNMNYGGRSLATQRVVFVHGTLDPWSHLGITTNPPKGIHTIMINGSGQCADMIGESRFDSQEVIDARSKVSELIGALLSGK